MAHDQAPKDVRVLSPEGRFMNQTSRMTAQRSVRQMRAVWVGKNAIQLKMTKQQRLRMYDRIIEQADFRCQLCYGHMCGERIDPEQATVDHVIPLSRGGTDEPTNLLCASRQCNELKGDLTLAEFQALYGVTINANVAAVHEGICHLDSGSSSVSR